MNIQSADIVLITVIACVCTVVEVGPPFPRCLIYTPINLRRWRQWSRLTTGDDQDIESNRLQRECECHSITRSRFLWPVHVSYPVHNSVLSITGLSKEISISSIWIGWWIVCHFRNVMSNHAGTQSDKSRKKNLELLLGKGYVAKLCLLAFWWLLWPFWAFLKVDLELDLDWSFKVMRWEICINASFHSMLSNNIITPFISHFHPF